VIDLLHFVRPWWLLGTIPAIAIALIWARQRMAASHWESSIDSALLEVLLEPGGRGSFKRISWLLACALAIGALGIAGPAWERLPQPVLQKSDALVIVLDLSLSMFARDVQPSRLVRARQKITDVLRLRNEGFTGLVVYAGDAHAVAPLTDDTKTIENLLASLGPEMMPVLGSNLESALTISRELFENARVQQGRILLVTDGIDDVGDIADFRQRNYPISILGIGTSAGSNIPLDFVNQPGQVLRTKAGEAIFVRLDSEHLARTAESAYGRYRQLSLSDEDIAHLLGVSLPQDDETIEVEREFDTWADMGFMVCIILLPLVLLSFRRGLLVVVCLSILPFPAEAGIWDDLWQRSDQQGQRALREDEPQAAVLLFDDPLWRAVAQYRSEDYANAADGFSHFSQPDDFYNLGNALAQYGEYEAALAAYDQTLTTLPDHADALYNREIVEKLLEEQQSAEQSDDSGGDQGSNPEDSDEQQPGSDEQQSQDQEQEGEQGDQPPEADSQSDQSDGDSSDQADADLSESTRDEKKDALEQWLRRVPDDPGGLLRRKFQYETNQRRQRGDYSNRETEKIW
jgi:Ca-activated chloride channel family protein